MLIKRCTLFVFGLALLSKLTLVQCEDNHEATQEQQDSNGNNANNNSEEVILPTAVATVYEEKGDQVAVAEGNSTTDETNNGTSSSGEEKKDDDNNVPPTKPPGPVRVQVACWDYRNIALYPPDPEPSSTEEGTPSSNNDTNSGVPPVDEEIVAEPVEEEQEQEGESAPTTEIENGGAGESSSDAEETSSGSEDTVDNGGEEQVSTEGQEEGPIINLDESRTVELVNVSHLMNEVLFQNPAVRGKSVPGNCTVVLFYAAWCPFCAKAAPHYNALPRAYPPLRVVAINIQKWKTVNTFFGILGVPTIALFHNGRLISKFNSSQFTINKFSEFIEYFTDLKHEERMNVTAKDFEGPVPSVPEREKDLLLLVAWIFLLLAGTHYITKSIIWWRFVEFVRATWREAELEVRPHHHHQNQQQPHEHND